MTPMKHSPGPWKWQDGDSRNCLHAADGSFVATFDGDLTPETAEGNRVLLAAAPEMLELLREMEDDLQGHWLSDHDERCTNMLTPDGRCAQAAKGRTCYCQRPDSLDKARALLARIEAP